MWAMVWLYMMDSPLWSLTVGVTRCVVKNQCYISKEIFPISRQDIEQEPPVRPPLPQELQESHHSRDHSHGWTESPYEV